MKSYLAQLLAYILIISSFCSSLPSGAPICSIDQPRIEKAHGAAYLESLDYQLSVSQIDDKTFEMTIKSSTETSFKGVLIYVVGKDQNTHVGSFVLPNDNFKFQSDVCKSQGVGGNPESTVTHANPSDKSVGETKFIWKVSDGDSGRYKVEAIVAKDRNPWKIIKDIPIDVSFKPPYGGASVSQILSSSAPCTTKTSTMSESKSAVTKMLVCSKVKKSWGKNQSKKW